VGKSLDLKTLFHPRSVALIGVSTEQTKLSGRPFRFFREFGYAGSVYPVNPKYREVAGVPCFAKLADVPGEVDLAVITLPASAVPEALVECGTKRVKAAAIISSGFAEVGGEGVRLQEELKRVAFEYGIAVCGPNCSGFVYFPERVTASFTVGLDGGLPEPGPAAFVSQSGALSSYILGAARERGLGFRYWITTGNECVLSFTDYLQYLLEDPDVRLVLGYLEDARDGPAFLAAARRALSPSSSSKWAAQKPAPRLAFLIRDRWRAQMRFIRLFSLRTGCCVPKAWMNSLTSPSSLRLPAGLAASACRSSRSREPRGF
jgi:acetate---CoA ligase (ADP-forming)